MTEREAITKLKRRAYRTTCYGNKVLEHEENLVAIEALEKQIPKKPINYDKHYYKCPCCNEDLEIDNDMLFVYDEEPPKFCIKCGQKLDFKEV